MLIIILQLRTEIEIFQKEYYELQAKKIDIKRVSDLVLAAYAREFANQTEDLLWATKYRFYEWYCYVTSNKDFFLNYERTNIVILM